MTIAVDVRHRLGAFHLEARFESAGLTMAGASHASGAPLYTSPEQAVGENVDVRTDIFALGAVAYRILTGQDAFAAESPQRVLARVIHDHPRPAAALVPGLPAGVDEVLARVLAKSRKDRYADANSLCDDLDDVRTRARHAADFIKGAIDE